MQSQLNNDAYHSEKGLLKLGGKSFQEILSTRNKPRDSVWKPCCETNINALISEGVSAEVIGGKTRS